MELEVGGLEAVALSARGCEHWSFEHSFRQDCSKKKTDPNMLPHARPLFSGL